MAHLGDFGTRHERDDTFGWFGTTIRVHPQATDLHLVDFLRAAQEIDDDDVANILRTLHGVFAALVHPEDFETFWSLALANGQNVEDLMGLVRSLTEGQTGRPSRRRSGSSTGRRGTGASLRDVSSKQVIRQLERQGRPDLAMHVVAAHDARAVS